MLISKVDGIVEVMVRLMMGKEGRKEQLVMVRLIMGKGGKSN